MPLLALDVTRGRVDDGTLARLDLVNLALPDGPPDAAFETLVQSCASAGKALGILLGLETHPKPVSALSTQELTDLVARRARAAEDVAKRSGTTITRVKPAGTLSESVSRSPAVADAFARGVVDALGPAVGLLVPPGSALGEAAASVGVEALREGYADRRAASDGRPLPIGQSLSFFQDPQLARARACALVASGDVDVVSCDDRSPVIVAAVHDIRDELDVLSKIELTSVELEPELRLGDGAMRFILPFGLRADAAPAPTSKSMPPSPIPVSIDRRRVLDALRAHPGVIDANLTETRACVYFDPATPARGPWTVHAPLLPRRSSAREYVIPVWYDGEDLDAVAQHAGLSRADTAKLHASNVYRVTMIGAFPGFAYLRGIDPRLVLPRRHAPRLFNPRNVIGIAAGYTGIFPWPSPNGWSLVGTARDFVGFTPESGSCFQIGDSVRFEVAGT